MAMNILLSRKAVVFTLMALVMASVIVTSVQLLNSPVVANQDAQLLRVGIADEILESFLAYSQSSLRATTYASLNNLSNVLSQYDGDNMTMYFSNKAEFDNNVLSCVRGNTNLKLQGVNLPPMNCITQNYTGMLEVFRDLINESYNINIVYEFDDTSFLLNQNLPYEAIVSFNFSSVTIIDPASSASWTLLGDDLQINAYVPLQGIKDPITTKFSKSTHANGLLPYSFIQRKNAPLGATEVYDALTQKQFFRSSSAPSFLQRYYMNTSWSASACCGVESFIDGSSLKPALWTQNGESFAAGSGTKSNYSHVDHQLLVSTFAGNFSAPKYSCSGNTEGVLRALDFGTNDTRSYFWFSSSSPYSVAGENLTSC